MTKKKHEELVEEARLLWCEECADGPLGYEYGFDPEVDDPCATGCEDLCTERAKKVVTLILSAVRDGRLDEELGVVGRLEKVNAPWYPSWTTIKHWVVRMLTERTRTFIALRGTGKEEAT